MTRGTVKFTLDTRHQQRARKENISVTFFVNVDEMTSGSFGMKQSLKTSATLLHSNISTAHHANYLVALLLAVVRTTK